MRRVVFLSQIRNFKLWELQVELNQTLDRAKEITESLSRLAANSAKATYMQMAYANRMGGPSAKERQVILDETAAQLKDMKTSPAAINEIQRPYVQMITLDFFFLNKSVLREYATLRYAALGERVKNKNTLENVAAVEAHSERITKWTARTSDSDPNKRLVNSSLEAELERFMPKEGEWLEPNEREIAKELKSALVKLNADCEKKGGYTEQAAAFYDQYRTNGKKLAEEYFAPALNALAK
jgi:hypothetical protein